MSDHEQSENPQAPSLPGGDNLGQIREIIFGSQMRDYDSRFAELEQRMQQDKEQMLSRMENGFEQLKQVIVAEVEQLMNAINQERADRDAMAQQLYQRLEEVSAELNSEIAALRQESERTTQSVRDDMYEQGQQLSSSLQQMDHELRDNLDQESRRLSDEKMGREQLANFLNEMANRVNGQQSE